MRIQAGTYLDDLSELWIERLQLVLLGLDVLFMQIDLVLQLLDSSSHAEEDHNTLELSDWARRCNLELTFASRLAPSQGGPT